MSRADLTPWRYVEPPERSERLSHLTPATGWYAVYAWRGEGDTIELAWEPVACWAIHTLDGEDDVVPIVRFEGGPSLTIATGDDRPVGLHTEAERQDETVLLRLRDDARRHLESEEASARREQQERDAVHAFVAAQPDPAAFAARMRTGATSMRHAWMAITLADGDPERAATLAHQSDLALMRLMNQRPALR